MSTTTTNTNTSTTTVPSDQTVISASQLHERWQRDPDDQMVLIDVRSGAEFRAAHISFAKNVPLDQLDPQAIASQYSDVQQIYFICHSGGRSTRACSLMSGQTDVKIVNVEGGMQAARSTGLPITKSRGAISLERQVRIAAGGLVLTGGLLTALVHPYFLALPIFVGSGLVFAGVTDTCGMALLLTRMPWNR